MVEKKVERDSSGPGWHRTEVTACQWIIEAAIRGSEAEGGMVVIFFFFGCLGRFFVERVERSFFFFFNSLLFFLATCLCVARKKGSESAQAMHPPRKLQEPDLTCR